VSPTRPFLTIVTVHLNDLNGLLRTLHSLEPYREHPEVEWLVVDGASDWSGDGASAARSRIERAATRFVSERDSGVYDAMNKGAGLATGDYVMFLNAGDELHPRFDLDRLMTDFAQTGTGMVWGRCVEVDEKGREVLVKTRSPGWAWYGTPVYHPAVLFTRAALGPRPYDDTLRIAADYDLLCRLVTGGVTVRLDAAPFARFHRGGLSDIEHRTLLREERIIRARYWRIPGPAAFSIDLSKRFLKRLSRVAWLRKLWREKI